LAGADAVAELSMLRLLLFCGRQCE
jgi:hypothetical protein